MTARDWEYVSLSFPYGPTFKWNGRELQIIAGTRRKLTGDEMRQLINWLQRYAP